MPRNDLDDTTTGGEDPNAPDVIDATLPAWAVLSAPDFEMLLDQLGHPQQPLDGVDARVRLGADGSVKRSIPALGAAEITTSDGLSREELVRLLVLYARRMQRMKTAMQNLDARVTALEGG